MSIGMRASLALITLALSTPARSHGDHGTSGGTVLPAGITLVGLDYDVVQFRPIADARLLDLTANGEHAHSLKSISVPSLSIAYGLTNDLTVAVRLPYLANRQIRETGEDPAEPDIAARGGVYGFGDVPITATYRIIHDARSGFNAAVILGVKAPTGRNDALDKAGVLFETEHQPGTGAWDGLFGATASKKIGPVTLTANALYTLSGDGDQNTTQGDRFTYGLSASYRLWTSTSGIATPMSLGGNRDGMMHHGSSENARSSDDHARPSHDDAGPRRDQAGSRGHLAPHHDGTPAPSSGLSLDVSLGINGVWSGRQTIDGVRDENTGGNVLFVTPGLRLSTDRWSSFVNVGLPLTRDPNGIQSTPDWHLSTGISLQF
jgi:hypothetical protein